MADGGHPGAESSILKIRGTEIQQRLTELFVEAAGQYILPYEGLMALSQIEHRLAQTMPAHPLLSI